MLFLYSHSSHNRTATIRVAARASPPAEPAVAASLAQVCAPRRRTVANPGPVAAPVFPAHANVASPRTSTPRGTGAAYRPSRHPRVRAAI